MEATMRLLKGANLSVIIALVGVCLSSADADAIQKCGTTLDCAQQAVDAAAQANAAMLVLQSRIDGVEAELNALKSSLGGERVIAMAEVKGSRLIAGSPNLTFDSGTGALTFPSPQNPKIIPAVSYISVNGAYATEDVYLKSVVTAPNSITVWQGALDTGGRNHPPNDFTAIVIGF